MDTVCVNDGDVARDTKAPHPSRGQGEQIRGGRARPAKACRKVRRAYCEMLPAAAIVLPHDRECRLTYPKADLLQAARYIIQKNSDPACP